MSGPAEAGSSDASTPQNNTRRNGVIESIWENWGSLRLENTGSVARDHLANERTFLAWLRTSLTFASIGVALAQLFRLRFSIDPDESPQGNDGSFHRLSTALGGLFVSTGILITVFGVVRYFSVQQLLLHNRFPASRPIILSSFAITIALVAITLGVLLHSTNNS